MRVRRAQAKDGRVFLSVNGNGRYHVTGKAVSAPAVKSTTAYAAALSTRLSEDWPITHLSADAANRWSLRQLRARSRDLERNGGIHSAYLDALEIDIIGSKGIAVQMKVKTGDEFAFENAKPVKGRVVTDARERGFLRVLKAKADSFRGAPGASKKRAYLREQDEAWKSALIRAVRAINAGQELFHEEPATDVMTVDGELDRFANFTIENEWRDFLKRGNFDVTGKHSGMDFCRLALRSSARDGDAIILVYLGYPNKWGIAFQLIEGDYADDYYNVEQLPNGNRIRMGIELDGFGRKVAIWVFAHHPGDYGVVGVNSYDPRRRRIAMLGEPPDPHFPNGRETVFAIHLARSKRAEETRPVPWITPAMPLIHDIEALKIAEITAARAEACKHMVYERDILDSPGGDRIEWGDYCGKPADELQPGLAEMLDPGVRAKLMDPVHPNAMIPDFLKAMKREVAMALGYCYNILFGDLSDVNYSSLRGGLQNQREGSKMGQQWFIDDAFERMHSAWLKMSLLTGALPFRFSEFDRLNQKEFKARRWQWVDPKNDADTAVLLIQNKLATRSEMISDRTGGDFEETVDELDYEEGYIAAKENLKAADEQKAKLEGKGPQAQPVAAGGGDSAASGGADDEHDPTLGD